MLCVPLFGDQPINARQLEVFVIFLYYFMESL